MKLKRNKKYSKNLIEKKVDELENYYMKNMALITNMMLKRIY